MQAEIELMECDEQPIVIFKIGNMGYVAKIEIETLLPDNMKWADAVSHLLEDYEDAIL